MRGPRPPAIAALLALGSIIGLAAPAAAHQTSIKYVDVAVDGNRATIRLTVAPGDVTEPLGLAADAAPSVDAAATPGVAAHVARWLAVGPDEGAPCAPQPPHAVADGRFVVVAWDVVCGAPLGNLALDLRGFFAVDTRHEAIVTVHAPGEDGDAQVVRAADPVLHVHRDAPAGLAGWVGAGVEHIWNGRDHACFVIALLLVVVLSRRGEDWTARPPLATLRRTAAIITAFTVAHSLSLIAASLGWVRLPGRLVESLIAFSILYTAIENIVRPDVRWRFALTFGFGLVHGLGFASVLQELLPAEHVIAPLLGFNVGVELGQLGILGIALPVVWVMARGIGAARYRRWIMPALSIAIAAVAIKWLIERVFALPLPTMWGM